jgi:flagellar protein FlaI
LEKHIEKTGVTEGDIRDELRQRATVLKWMVRKRVRRYTDVANVIREYYTNPDRVYRKARMDG